jgi:putative transposase
VSSPGFGGDWISWFPGAFNSLYKAELVRNKGPWRGIDDLEIATVEYIDWYNNRRLHGELGHIPPAEYEALHALTHPVTAPTVVTLGVDTHKERRPIPARRRSVHLVGVQLVPQFRRPISIGIQRLTCPRQRPFVPSHQGRYPAGYAR